LERAQFYCKENISAIFIDTDFITYVGTESGEIEKRNLFNGEIIESYILNQGKIFDIKKSNTDNNLLLIGCNSLLSFDLESKEFNTILNNKTIKINNIDNGYGVILLKKCFGICALKQRFQS
jgi:hypothetical protein